VIKATGTVSGGQGTAAATVTASLTEDGGGTAVTVATDLTVTGKPAQFGRGMIADITGKIPLNSPNACPPRWPADDRLYAFWMQAAVIMRQYKSSASMMR
jgi:hypothetical protein